MYSTIHVDEDVSSFYLFLAGAWARDILYVAEKSSIVQQLQEKIYKTVMKMYFADVSCSLAWSWKKKQLKQCHVSCDNNKTTFNIVW